jgi:hypothetical protein
MKAPADALSVESPLPCRQLSSHSELTGQKQRRSFSRASFRRALIPFLRALLSGFNYLSKTLPPNTMSLIVFII